MIIVVARQHGAGGSTVMNRLIKKYPGMRKLEMGLKFRQLAEERGMNIDEFSEFLGKNIGEAEKIDRAMDDYQKKDVAKGNIVVNSNLGAMVAPGADLKVLLVCDPVIRAKRVLEGGKRFGDGGAAGVGEMAKQLSDRDRNDSQRYKKLYGFDMFDEKNYDLVIDTGEMDKSQVVQKIVDELERRQET